jgi:flagellar protein FliL
MAEENESVKGGDTPEKEGSEAKGSGKKFNKLLIIAPVVAILLAAGGYFGYTFLQRGKGKAAKTGVFATAEKTKATLFPLDPFVVNLSEPGRYLKVTMQLELAGDANQDFITEKVPVLRDVIITMISSQSYEYVSSPEGKLQLKEELLLRSNEVFGKEIFRNLYFTDFVMQ